MIKSSAYNMGLPYSKIPKEGKNGCIKGENSFIVGGIHGVTLHPTSIKHIYIIAWSWWDFMDLGSYGEIMEHKCPMSWPWCIS